MSDVDGTKNLQQFHQQSDLLKGIEFKHHMCSRPYDKEYYQPDTDDILTKLRAKYEAGITDRYPSPNEIRSAAKELHDDLKTERFRLWSQMSVLEGIMGSTEE